MDAFLQYWHAYAKSHPDQRPGQALFNAAYLYEPTSEYADACRNTHHDPFYMNGRIPDFLNGLSEVLNNAS